MSTAAASLPTKIMIIRHGEKPAESDATQAVVPADKKSKAPSPGGPPFGVTPDGTQDPTSLTVRGWQRAGGLVRLFAPINGVFVNPLLAQPTYLYTMGVEAGHSMRPPQTVMPLAQELGVQPNNSFARGEEDQLWGDIKGRGGVVLICWEHDSIPLIAGGIPSDAPSGLTWPGHRFDLVWVFDLDPASGRYHFTETTQQLLPGDKPHVKDAASA